MLPYGFLIETALIVWFVWSVVRLYVDTLAPGWFKRTRLLHPLVIFGMSYLLMGQQWWYALLISALASIFTMLLAFLQKTDEPVTFYRHRRRGLPPLP